MIKCNYIAVNECDNYEQIVDEKQVPRKTRLNKLKSTIYSSYQEYLYNYTNLVSSNSVILDYQHKLDLQNCFTSPTKSFKEIRARIFAEQLPAVIDLCPYCFLNSPNTLDHYICESEFSEYSTLVKNLIPCCHVCNQKKGVNWRSNNRRLFIHFYIDNFLDRKFLFIKLKLMNEIPVAIFSLKNTGDLRQEEFEIIQNHFDKLDLLNLYSKRANNMLSNEIKAVKKSHSEGISLQILKRIFSDRSVAEFSTYGQNYWKAILIEGIGNSLEHLV